MKYKVDCKRNMNTKDRGEIIFESLLNISGLSFEKLRANSNSKIADYRVLDEFLVEVKRIEDDPRWEESTLVHNIWEFWWINPNGFDLPNFILGDIDVLKEDDFLGKIREILKDNILEINKERKQILVKENLNLVELSKKINLGLKDYEKICKNPEQSFNINTKNKQKKLVENIEEAVKQLEETEKKSKKNYKKVVFILNDTTWMDLEEFFPKTARFSKDIIFYKIIEFNDILKQNIEVILYQQKKLFSGKSNYLICFIDKNNQNGLLTDLLIDKIEKGKISL